MVWLPTGTIGNPATDRLREAKLGDTGITFRGMRIDQGGTVTLGDRVLLKYGGEYLLIGLGRAVSSVRPRVSVQTKLGGEWRGTMVFASQPGAPNALETGSDDLHSSLVRALDELDSFPALMWRDGRPVVQGGWKKLPGTPGRQQGKIQFAGFHVMPPSGGVWARK
jgi:hypothetical protein